MKSYANISVSMPHVVLIVFITYQSGCDGVFAGIEILLDCPQFRQMVPESEIYYLDPDSLILYDYIEVPVSSVHDITTSDYCSLGIVSVFKNGSAGVVYNVNLNF